MVELRKRPASTAAPLPAKKKAASRSKTEKEEPADAVETPAEVALEPEPQPVPEASAPAAETQPATKAIKKGPAKVGDSIDLDTFGGEVKNNDGEAVTLAKLVADSKTGVVLFTYPKASTPGCTTQACLFRDAYAPLTATGLSIFGLSTDSPKSNTTFKTKQKLPYPLLCDPSATLIQAIGFKKAPKGTQRGVFVVDKAGKVLAAQPGGPANTVEVVKNVVQDMGGRVDLTEVHKAEERAVAAEEAEAEDKMVADTAGDVADSAVAANLDQGKT